MWRRRRKHPMGVTSGMHLDCLLHRWGFWMQDPKQPITAECSTDHGSPVCETAAVHKNHRANQKCPCTINLYSVTYHTCFLRGFATIQCNPMQQTNSKFFYCGGFFQCFSFFFSFCWEYQRGDDSTVCAAVALNCLILKCAPFSNSIHPSIYLSVRGTVWLISSFGKYLSYSIKENINITYVRVHSSGSGIPFKGLVCKIKGPASRLHLAFTVTLCEQHRQLRHDTGNMNQISIFSPVSIYYPRKKKKITLSRSSPERICDTCILPVCMPQYYCRPKVIHDVNFW